MKKVVWTAAVATLAVTCLGATPASAQQPGAAAGKHRLRARIERRVEKRFKTLDANGDGAIERSEWSGKAKLFDRFDRDHDGSLSPAEFRELAGAVGKRGLRKA